MRNAFAGFLKDKGPLSVFLSVVCSVLLVVAVAEAATTISTNINTGGTLTVTGASSLTGVVDLYGTKMNLGTGSATTTLTAISATAVGFNTDIDLYGRELRIGTGSATSTLSALSTSLGLDTDFDVYGGDFNLGTGSATTTLSSASGLLGLGSTTPAARFSIEQKAVGNLGFYLAGYPSATADLVRISTSTASATTTAFVVNNDGQVGIGTATPAARGLSVTGSGLFGTTNATTSLIVDSTQANTGGCIQLRAPNGTWLRIYATSTVSSLQGDSPYNLVVQPGACQ